MMRLIVLILTVFGLQLAHAGYAQNVSLTVKRASLKQVIATLSNQSGYTFFYDQKYLSKANPVSIDAKNQPIENIIEQIFTNQPFVYEIIDQTITLKPKKGMQESTVIEQQDRDITGKVTDTLGNPLPGASVRVKGGKGTTTNQDGVFTLTDIPENAVLIISYLGSMTQEVPASTTAMTIVLKEDSSALEEVVVVGFGTQKKINLTGAVSQVTSEVLSSRPVSNIGQALQGVIPNLNVTIANGSPNTAPAINVRGGTSFFKDVNDNNRFKFSTGSPLILVDGIEMDLNQLNPEDIESISVLKDAASAAIYGARAAYGVMLVTTKKGQKNAGAKINYDNMFQWNRPSVVPDLLDAYTIQEAVIKAEELQNRTPTSDMLEKLNRTKAHMDDPINNPMYFMDPGNNIIWVGNTDVYGEALRASSPMQKHNLSLSGGSEKTSFYGAIGYLGQDGLYKINTDKFKRYNAMLNISSTVSDWFAVEMRSSYNNSDYKEPVFPSGKGGWWVAMAQEPGRNINMPIKTPIDAPMPDMYTDNILSFMDYGSLNNEKKETIILGASPIFTPLKGWKIRGDFSYKSYNYDRKQVVPELRRIETRWDAYTTTHTNPNYVERWKQHSNQYTINAYTDYNYILDKHDFYGLLGYNQEWYTYDYLGGRGEDILSPNIPVIGQTLGNEYAYDNEEHWAIRGAFYRFTYNYDGKYLFESNGRYDGTSRFPKDSRFKFFASFSGAWRITGERFAQAITPVVNDLKLRASYGSLGNQNVANYIYIPSYATVNQVDYLFDGIRPVGIRPPGLVDPYLTWETATTIDFGIDMTLFKKLDLSFDWYRRTTKNILVDGDKLPSVIGTSAPTKNSGEMKTTGWELSSKWRDRLDNGLSYDVAFTLSDYQSEIVSFDGNPNKLISNEALYAGKKMGEIWGYETVGIFQDQAQIDAAPSQALINSGIWFPGDIQYRDLNGDETIGPGANTLADPGDQKIIGNSTPRFQFGLNMNASYKNFDINLFFQGVGKRDFYIGSNLFWGAINGGAGTWEVYNNSWTPERTEALYPAYKSKSANVISQTRFMQNAAYIRLKNVTVGYTLPKQLTSKVKLDRLRVFGAAYNIWEYSKVPGIFDPEVLSVNYPMIRSLAFGVQVGF